MPIIFASYIMHLICVLCADACMVMIDMNSNRVVWVLKFIVMRNGHVHFGHEDEHAC